MVFGCEIEAQELFGARFLPRGHERAEEGECRVEGLRLEPRDAAGGRGARFLERNRIKSHDFRRFRTIFGLKSMVFG